MDQNEQCEIQTRKDSTVALTPRHLFNFCLKFPLENTVVPAEVVIAIFRLFFHKQVCLDTSCISSSILKKFIPKYAGSLFQLVVLGFALVDRVANDVACSAR